MVKESRYTYCLQTQIVRLLEAAVDRLAASVHPTAPDIHEIYSLSAVLDLPLEADTEAVMTKLLRHCGRLRPLSDISLQASLDILVVIAGVCFGQDLSLRYDFRE